MRKLNKKQRRNVRRRYASNINRERIMLSDLRLARNCASQLYGKNSKLVGALNKAMKICEANLAELIPMQHDINSYRNFLRGIINQQSSKSAY